MFLSNVVKCRENVGLNIEAALLPETFGVALARAAIGEVRTINHGTWCGCLCCGSRGGGLWWNRCDRWRRQGTRTRIDTSMVIGGSANQKVVGLRYASRVTRASHAAESGIGILIQFTSTISSAIRTVFFSVANSISAQVRNWRRNGCIRYHSNGRVRCRLLHGTCHWLRKGTHSWRHFWATRGDAYINVT